MQKISDTNAELVRRASAIEDRLSSTKERLEQDVQNKTDEQDLKMEEFRRSSESAQRKLERETLASIKTQKEEADALFNDIKKIMAAKNDEQDESNMKEQSELRTQLQQVRQNLERAQTELESKISRGDSKVDSEVRDWAKTHVDNLNEELTTLQTVVEAHKDAAETIVYEEVKKRTEEVADTRKASATALAEATEELKRDLAKTQKGLTGEIKTLETKVDGEVSDKISELRSTMTGQLEDLKTHVEGSVDKSIQDMTHKMDAMKTQVQQEMKPELKAVKAVAERADEGLNTYKSIAGAAAEDLEESVKKTVAALSEEMDKIEAQVDQVKATVTEMQGDTDINKLLMDAVKLHP
jgi:chromosome segregation ATPase